MCLDTRLYTSMKALYSWVSSHWMLLYVCVSSQWRLLYVYVSSHWRLYTFLYPGTILCTFVCPGSWGSLRWCMWSIEALYVSVSGGSISLIVQPQRLYTFVCTAMEALYVCVSSQFRVYMFVCPLSWGSIRLCVQPWRLYTFAIPVSCWGSICLHVQLVEALYVCVSSHWRLYTFVCPVIGGSTRLCVESVMAHTLCFSSYKSSI